MTMPISETQKVGLTNQEHKNLLLLLLSPDQNNRLLAFHLMEGNLMFAEAMSKELLIISKFCSVAKWKKRAQQLIIKKRLLLNSYEAMSLEEGLQLLGFIEDYKEPSYYGGVFNFNLDNINRFEQLGAIDYFLLDDYLQKFSTVQPLLDEFLLLFKEEDALYYYYLDLVGALLYFDRLEQAAYMERCYERLTKQSLIAE